jgi:hypothetical protein
MANEAGNGQRLLSLKSGDFLVMIERIVDLPILHLCPLGLGHWMAALRSP